MICLGLASCAQLRPQGQAPVPYYVAPAAGTPTARLLMRATLLPGETYGVYVFGGAQDCTQLQRVGYGTVTQNPDATTLASDRLDTLELVIFKPNHFICRTRLSFLPKTGRSYVLTSTSLADGCRSSVLDATNPDAIRPEPSTRHRSQPGNLCAPLAQSPLLSSLPRSGSSDSAPERNAPSSGTRPPGAVTDDDLKGLTGR